MKTSEEKVLAGVVHLGIFLQIAGIILALVIYLLQKEKSTYVSEQAKQALGYQIVVIILSSLISLIGVGTLFGGFIMGPHIATGLLGLVIGLINLAFAVYAIYGAYCGFGGRYFEYAVIGDFVKKI